MATSSAGSNTFLVLALVAIAVIVLLLLRHYLPLRTTPSYLLLPVFLALALPASIIVLVPIDLNSSTVTQDESHRGIWLPGRELLVWWRISYWLTFVLTWFVLPLLGEYSDSGHREPKARLLYSLRTNLRYYLIALACSIAGLTYFFISSGLGLSNFEATVIALAYAWGLVLAIYLMGHGLVAIPRKLYRNASTTRRLRGAQASAPGIHEKLVDAIEGLEVLEKQILQLRQRKSGTAREYQDWIEQLAASSDLPEARSSTLIAAQLPEGTVPAVITERYLADLTRKLKRARHRRIRFVQEWASCVREARDLQTILDSSSSRKLTFSNDSTGWTRNPKLLTPNTRYIFYTNIAPILRISLAALSALASFAVVWTELFSFFPSLSLIGRSILHRPSSSHSQLGFGGQVLAAFWLCYMTAAALTSISEVRVWGNRALVVRHTYAESACWYAALVARLTVPLSYNFCTFVPDGVFKGSAFYAFLGQSINLTPLGKGFSALFPIAVLVPVIATAFNLYGRIKTFAGYGAFEDEVVGFETGWREGKALIERELSGSGGATVDAVGLSSRDHSPRPPVEGQSRGAALLPQYRDDPLTSVSSSPNLQPQATAGARPPNQRRRLGGGVQDEDDTEGNFFADFAHRVRNTLDTVDKPDWVQKLDIKKPKWMDGGVDAGGSSGTNGSAGNVFGRLFGKKGEGGVRL